MNYKISNIAQEFTFLAFTTLKDFKVIILNRHSNNIPYIHNVPYINDYINLIVAIFPHLSLQKIIFIYIFLNYVLFRIELNL